MENKFQINKSEELVKALNLIDSFIAKEMDTSGMNFAILKSQALQYDSIARLKINIKHTPEQRKTLDGIESEEETMALGTYEFVKGFDSLAKNLSDEAKINIYYYFFEYLTNRLATLFINKDKLKEFPSMYTIEGIDNKEINMKWLEPEIKEIVAQALMQERGAPYFYKIKGVMGANLLKVWKTYASEEKTNLTTSEFEKFLSFGSSNLFRQYDNLDPKLALPKPAVLDVIENKLKGLFK